ncbi:amidohydrolase family protein [uncultured Winogradskyella sp.]|uniref:amidohydrolase family protein n=1 Tax=uncultured Winogradskyella sp. TaxID=395353 RepID=UPI00261BFEEA|nr:amidohydrolase family protein [uncultured Winogradskyella sp.]
MYRTFIFICFFSIVCLSCQSELTIDADVVISNVNIIDVVTGDIEYSKDVFIKENRIIKIEPNSENKTHKETKIVEGSGKYLIPGLWDMHTHPDDPEVWRMNPKTEEKDLLLPLFVVNGVTGIRDMAGDLNLVKRWRRLSDNDSLLAPKIVAGGPLLDGPNPMWDGSVGIASKEQVKHVVDSLIVEGVDFLKVYSLLPREIYLELSIYANAIDFPFVGHVPFTVRPSEAAVTGMKSQEHLLEIIKECSLDFDEKTLAQIKLEKLGVNRYIIANNFRINHYNETKADSLYQTFVKYNIWHTPTLSMWYKNAWFEEELIKDNELLSYLPKYLQEYWTPKHNDHLKNRDHKDFIDVKKRLYAKYLHIVSKMNSKGVKLLAGTDMGANPLCFPGIGLYNELEAFIDADLSPLQALQTATINPAIFLKIESDYGTVTEGKIADLLLLDKNPLDEMSNLRTINAVIQNGNVYNSNDILRIKKEIKDKINN